MSQFVIWLFNMLYYYYNGAKTLRKKHELPALEAGANDFLKKPFDYAIIKARINVMLNTGVTSHASDGDGERDTVVFQEAEGNERRLQSVKEETTGESVRKKKIPEAKRLNSALVVCFSFIPNLIPFPVLRIPKSVLMQPM